MLSTNTDTANIQRENDRHIQHAIDRLLRKLLAFVAVYPLRSDAEMPEHSVAWLTGIAEGEHEIV